MTPDPWPTVEPDLRPTWAYLGIVAVVLLVLSARADAAALLFGVGL